MAFLDNSGTIILDTVLTEIGRKRMATGNFRISKFALGDDEIDYNLYDKNNASGSAYYDLEILQTPVFQATTGVNANINYGLLSYRNTNLLYLPTMKRNNLVINSVAARNNVFYLAVNDGGVTSTALIDAFGGMTGGGSRQILQAGQLNGSCIIMETGLDTAELLGTSANKQTYLAGNGLIDSSFQVSVDTRFINAVLGPTANTKFNNAGVGGESNIVTTLSAVLPTTNNQSMNHFSIAQVRAVNNQVIYRVADTTADTTISVISGPRASVTFLNFGTATLAVTDFTRHGKTGQSISGASGTYRYIDTSVSILGSAGTMDQLPIRIIQKE
tara:strand:- start:1803 stop:2792 length:990 start_codon:yes stop_codon:yes gene_type:complete